MSRLAILVLLAGCDWSLHRMQEQPSCRPLSARPLLATGGCELAPPEGTIAFAPPEGAVSFVEPAEPSPPPLTRALVERGRDRFERFCAPCHGVAGDGDSQVARAMQLRTPPTLVAAPVTAFDDARILYVMERGYGVMPEYATALSVNDRYAILHYLRVLQQRAVPLASLSPALREEATQWLR